MLGLVTVTSKQQNHGIKYPTIAGGLGDEVTRCGISIEEVTGVGSV